MVERICGAPSVSAWEFDGFSDSALEVFFQPGLFGDFARLGFPPPLKVDAILASELDVSDRAVRAWMSGDAEAPPIAYTIIMLAIQRRCRRKRSLQSNSGDPCDSGVRKSAARL